MKDKTKERISRITTFTNSANQIRKRESYFNLYKESIPLIEKLSQPLFVLVLIMMFWSPLKLIVDSIPTLLGRTSRVTMGDLAFEIKSSILINPPDNIRPYINGLSIDAISFLIINGREDYYSEGYWCETTKEDIYGFHPGIKELENRGLVSIIQKEFACLKWTWSLTDIGRETYIFIKDTFIEEFIISWEEAQ